MNRPPSEARGASLTQLRQILQGHGDRMGRGMNRRSRDRRSITSAGPYPDHTSGCPPLPRGGGFSASAYREALS
ncbi:hypothetical protein LMIY3S_03485 [Labrys miyagiensis]